MEDNILKNDDYKIWWLIPQTWRAMNKVRKKELLKTGLSAEEVAVLLIIKSIGYKVTAAEISRWTLRANHTTTDLLNRMAKKGLIVKVKDLEPKNLVRIAITDKGQEACNKSSDITSIHKLLGILSKKEIVQFRSILQKLRDNALEEGGIDNRPAYPMFE